MLILLPLEIITIDLDKSPDFINCWAFKENDDYYDYYPVTPTNPISNGKLLFFAWSYIGMINKYFLN